VAPCTSRSLVCIPLTEFSISVVCRKNHPRLGDTATLAEIAKERFTLFESRENEIKDYQKQYDTFPLTDRNVAFRSSSMMSIANIIHSSDLVALIPTAIFELLKDALQLKEISLPKPLQKFTMHMIYSRSSMSSPFFSEIIGKAQNSQQMNEK
jgi:DNA-binding transcriptional LysR family regulator